MLSKLIFSLLITTFFISISFADRPNFILVYVDDLGWTDSSVEMIKDRKDTASDFYQTPNLMSFAKEGTVFSSAYAPAPVCTPSRNSMLHGMSPAYLWNSVLYDKRARKHYRGVLTIPQALKKVDPDYMAAHFGKWHISSITPDKAGYDISDGPTGNGEGDYMDDMKTVLPDSDPKRMIELTDKTINFVSKQVKDKKPFFVQLSHYAVHIWHDSKLSTREKYRKLPRGIKSVDSDYLPENKITESTYKHNWLLNYAAMIDEMDQEFGRLLKKVDELGIKDNTYIIFTSDNGGGLRGNLPLRGAKGDLTEGGIRVPFIVRGPKVKVNNYVSKAVVGWDLLPTIYDLAGGSEPLPKEIEGGTIRQLLEKGDEGMVKRKHEALIFHFPWYNGEPESAIRIGDLKLLKNLDTQQCQLFNVSIDPDEKHDLSKQKPEIASSMENKLSKYLKAIDTDDVNVLRKGYLDRLENNWLPHETKKVADLRKKLAAGDSSVSKEIKRIDGYIKWMQGEIKFTKDRLKAAGH